MTTITTSKEARKALAAGEDIDVCGTARPRIEVYGESMPRIVVYGESMPRIEVYGATITWITGLATVDIKSPEATVYSDGLATVAGVGAHRVIKAPVTPGEWCERYGVSVVDGVATLYKGVDNDWCSLHGTSYAPGTTPVADDWDGGERECGCGLRFSPRASMTLRYNSRAARFVACLVRLDDIAVYPNPTFPDRIKARCCCGPCREVDIDGELIEAEHKE